MKKKMEKKGGVEFVLYDSDRGLFFDPWLTGWYHSRKEAHIARERLRDTAQYAGIVSGYTIEDLVEIYEVRKVK